MIHAHSDTSPAPGRESSPGISAISVHLPQRRVSLEDWCEWNGASWPKIEAVVGRAFRVCGPDENVYTLAATAVLRLIVDHEVDPNTIGFLGFGTESSTDNAAGAVILKGMVDDALVAAGRPTISRACEVPEFKHACLGGVYAMKGGLRYLATDGANRVAIVVSADVAEYERGSTGEPTQGAGAVAFLLEPKARMLELDLGRAGRSAEYRGVDFRKPFARHFMPGYAVATKRVHDFPVFNGKYSTSCYVDAVNHALDAMADKASVPRNEMLAQHSAIFFHRPYRNMPVQALAATLVWGAARNPAQREELEAWCSAAGVSVQAVLDEHHAPPRLIDVVHARGAQDESAPHTKALIKHVKRSEAFKAYAADRMGLGASWAQEVGNLYTASLPAWIAAGFEDAAQRGDELAGATWLLVGYGSGDAAEAIPARVVPGWQTQANKIGFARSVEAARTLTQAQYEALHDGDEADVGLTAAAFVIDRVGDQMGADFQDIGIEYYRWRG